MPVDYAALAAQARGESAPVDYTALANQARGVNAAPSANNPPTGGIHVPLPEGLQPSTPGLEGAHPTFHKATGGIVIPDSNPVSDGISQAGQGVIDIGSGNHPARGVSNIIRGVGKATAPLAAMGAVAAPVAAVGGAIGGAAGSAIGSGAAHVMGADQDTQDAVGDVAGLVGGAYGAEGAGKLADGIKALRTPHPDLTFQNAVSVHPADTDFNSKVPGIRAGIQRGAQLTGSKVTNPQSAIDATEAAQHELIEALADHKTNARRAGLKMPVEQVKAAQRAAIPAGLEDSDPVEYHSLMEAINSQFPNKTHLDVDDVFNQAKLNNSRLNAFYSGREAAQNAKLMTNSGDTGVLKAAGDAYRQWIGDNLGPVASDLNQKWGDLNGAKHYLQAKINPSIREQPVTPLEGMMEKAGVDLGGSNPVHGIIKGVGKKIIGRPSGIDALLRSSFENTQPAGAPMSPNLIPHRIEAPQDTSYVRGTPAKFGEQRLLGTPDIVTPPPADTSSVRAAAAHQPFRTGFPPSAPKQLPAPAQGQPPLNVLPQGGREIVGINPRSWANSAGDMTGKEAQIISPRGRPPINRHAIIDPLDLQQYVDLGR